MDNIGSLDMRPQVQLGSKIRPYITDQDSDFIALARILMIIALVFHHVFTLTGSSFYPREGLDTATAHIADYMNSIIHWSSMAAVPCLSLISGYLFFRRANINYFNQLHRRITTVVLPSLFWTSSWFFFAYLIHTWGKSHGYFDWLDYDFDRFGPKLYLNGTLGINRLPFAYQFWFIHDLVLTFMLCPLIGWLIRRIPWVVLTATGLIWMLNVNIQPFFSTNVLFFFILGALSATTRFDLEWCFNFLKPFRWLIGLVFVALLLGRIFQSVHHVFASYPYLCLLRGVGLLVFMLAIRSLTSRDNAILRTLRYLSPLSFFIFAFHYPTLEFIRAIVRAIPGHDSEMGMLFFFFALPTTCVGITFLTALFLHWLSPPFFKFINGGRSIKVGDKKIMAQPEITCRH